MKGNKFMYCLKTTHNWRLCTLGKAFTATFRRIFFLERLKVHHCTIHGVFFLETSTTLCKHGIYTSTLTPTLHWPILIQITIQIMPSSLHCRALKSSDITGQYWHRLILTQIDIVHCDQAKAWASNLLLDPDYFQVSSTTVYTGTTEQLQLANKVVTLQIQLKNPSPPR